MRITHVALVTYHCPHLKTEQVLHGLLRKPYELSMYALPFKARKARSPRLQHRPEQMDAVAPEVLARKHGIPYVTCESDRDIAGPADIYLILGAGILSPECVANKRILNCHPGIIPASRGLDSFKWALHAMQPLGVTLHYIDERVDQGEIVAVVPTEVYRTDTFATLARRHYENEIDVLTRFEEFLNHPTNPYADLAEGEAHMRMPGEKEDELVARFGEYTAKYGGERAVAMQAR
jgi:phosphoribosylglycinamide formyltransferase 1